MTTQKKNDSKGSPLATDEARAYAATLANQGHAVTPDEATSLIPVEDSVALDFGQAPAGMLGTIDDRGVDFAAIVKQGFEIAPIVLKIEPGKWIVGKLLGKGEPIITKERYKEKNPATGEIVDVEIPKSLPTWLLEHSGVKGLIISSYQLDRDMPPFIGRRVQIYRLANEQVGARQVARYVVAGEAVKPAAPQ